MIPLIQPFAGLRPAPEQAAAVLAPPYDVVTTAAARAIVAAHPLSFLRISRAEVDLPADTDPYSPAVYRQARNTFDQWRAQGLLRVDPQPCYYLYRLTQDGHSQTGLVAATAIAAYEAQRIKKHELTRPDKEDDRVRHIEALAAQTGPALLVHRDHPRIAELLGAAQRAAPAVDCVAADGVRHELWVIDDAGLLADMTAAYETLAALYIADGHHRTAAAARVAAARRAAGVMNSAAERFLAVIFPQSETRIFAYHRVVRDLGAWTPAAFLQALRTRFTVTPSPVPYMPEQRGCFGLYLDGAWYQLALDAALLAAVAADPQARLDVSLVQEHLLAPLLGITDPRRDPRIDFVGGSRGLTELSERLARGDVRLALTLYPTAMADLLAIADAGAIMPPKSTWFAPKLADGLVSYLLA